MLITSPPPIRFVSTWYSEAESDIKSPLKMELQDEIQDAQLNEFQIRN